MLLNNFQKMTWERRRRRIRSRRLKKWNKKCMKNYEMGEMVGGK